MDFNALINHVTMIAAGSTVLATQILKSKYIPVQFEKFPVYTTAVVSLISTLIALATQHFSFAWHNWTDFLATFLTVLLVAALTYNHVLKPAVPATAIANATTSPVDTTENTTPGQ